MKKTPVPVSFFVSDPIVLSAVFFISFHFHLSDPLCIPL